MKEKIFDIIGMTSSTYIPQKSPAIQAKLLQMVERKGENLVPADGEPQGLVCSVKDLGILFADLIAPESKLLTKESIDSLVTPQFSNSSALAEISSW